MKTLRLFVLALLAMLLPLRGVSAGTLLCEQQPVSHSEVVLAAHDHGHSDSDSDKELHCLSSCSTAPLMATGASVLAPSLGGTTVFPHFAAPAPTFQSDGQERPPRCI